MQHCSSVEIMQPKLSANLANLITFWSLCTSSDDVLVVGGWFCENLLQQTNQRCRFWQTLISRRLYQVSDYLNFCIANQSVELCGRRKHGKTDETSSIEEKCKGLFTLWIESRRSKESSTLTFMSSLYWISKHHLTICDQREQHNFHRKIWILICSV